MTTTSLTADIVIGLDVGKTHHYAWVIDTQCKCLYKGKINQDQQSLTKLYTKAQRFGDTVMLVVDQPNNIGAFAVEVARQQGLQLGYLTGTRMRHASRLHAGNSKTDPKDAQIIAETAMRMPQSLQPVAHTEDAMQQLSILNGQIEDLIRTRTAYINRIRVTLLVICPILERFFAGKTLSAQWVKALILHYNSPQAIVRAGEKRLTRFLERNCPTVRNKPDKAHNLITAIASQTITMPHTEARWRSVQSYLELITHINDEIQQLQEEAEALAATMPEYQILLSMPGVGPKTAQTIIMCVGDLRDFHTPAELASYAGICPVTRQSGTSIKGEHVNRSGNKRLKNALWYSAFASIKSHERSRTYYQGKRDAGKRHNAAVMCLARRRTNVIFAMLKNHTFYDDHYKATGTIAEHPPQQAAA
ncbi:IS110 family transposase [Corynebacterium aquilae]|uniref:IS110 family transposase n=1 Tax=Corynebacterium aquilae TaxID=203263 RepID=UPI000953318F|nr:IS110 family transposase [Corynebacterium aquilae]